MGRRSRRPALLNSVVSLKGARSMSTTGTKPSKPAETQQRTPDELEFIKWMEKELGR